MSKRTIKKIVCGLLCTLFPLFFLSNVSPILMTSDCFLILYALLMTMAIAFCLQSEINSYLELIPRRIDSFRSRLKKTETRQPVRVKTAPGKVKQKKEVSAIKKDDNRRYVGQKTETRGEILREIGVSYEDVKEFRKKRTKEERETDEGNKKRSERNETLPLVTLLTLAEKGKISIGRHTYFGRQRGGDAVNAINDFLKKLGIKEEDISRKFGGRSVIKITKKAQRQLSAILTQDGIFVSLRLLFGPFFS